jgi:hypothetical protein
MTIKIEFPAGDMAAARVFGEALSRLANGGHRTDAEHLSAEADPLYFVNKGDSEANMAADLAEEQNRPTVGEEAEVDAAFESGNVAAETFGNNTGNDSTAAQCATQEQKAAGAHAASDGGKVDEKGVAFNAEFCSKAAIPFYGSGKKKGQWKKRQGVDEGAYDDWYADELFSGKIEDSSQEQANETTSDSNVAANAFGNNTAANTQTDEATPQDAGQLMKWVSEQQAAGNITQQQVTDAYTALQLPFDAVMNPAYPVADNCAAIYNHLKGQI